MNKWGKGSLSSRNSRYKGRRLKEQGTFRKLLVPQGKSESVRHVRREKRMVKDRLERSVEPDGGAL